MIDNNTKNKQIPLRFLDNFFSHFLDGPFGAGAATSFLGASTFGGSKGTPPFATLNLGIKEGMKEGNNVVIIESEE